MHRDAVLSLPEGLTNLGSSPKCEIQGMYKPGCVLSVQGHPEFDEQIMSGILEMRHEQGIFNSDMFKDAISRANQQHDGVLISSAVWRFILGI
jgi:GMP synthase-like glutamine amidotransferase